MLTVSTATLPGSRAASSLKRFVWASHTGVSSDGTTLSTSVLPAKSRRLTSRRPSGPRWCNLKSGARSPTRSSGPATGRGVPRIFTVRPAMGVSFLKAALGLRPRQRSEGSGRRGPLPSYHWPSSGGLASGGPAAAGRGQVAVAHRVESSLELPRASGGGRARRPGRVLGRSHAPSGQVRVLLREPLLHGDAIDEVLEGGAERDAHLVRPIPGGHQHRDVTPVCDPDRRHGPSPVACARSTPGPGVDTRRPSG